MIFISGPHAAGKTRCINHLTAQGYAVFDTGPMMREIHRSQSSNTDILEWVEDGEKQFGPNFANDLIAHEIARGIEQLPDPLPPILIAGYRTLPGIQYLHDHLPHLSGEKPVILFITADERILWQRFRDREAAAGHHVTEEDFALRRLREIPTLKAVEESATGMIRNEGSMEALFEQVQSFVDAQNIYMHDEGQAVQLLDSYIPHI